MLQDIVRAIEKRASAVGEESIPSIRALGRVAARTLKARRDLPPFDVSALDGYACKGDGAEFVVKALIELGVKPTFRLKAGEAAFVPTGAAIPACTRFVPVEGVQEKGTRILVKTAAGKRRVWKKGYWIRKADDVVSKGEKIRPRTMELLALGGLEQLAVYQRPRVSLLSTGNELKKGIIANSNQYLLAGLIGQDGGEIADTAIAGDDEGEIIATLRTMAGADLLLVTGGTARGKKDITSASLQRAGATLFLEGLPIVPGKTMTFGKLGRTLFFILPGNPRALRTLYEIFIKPCLFRLAGRISGAMRVGKASLPEEIEKEPHDGIHIIPIALSAGGDAHIRELYVDEPDGFIILEHGTERVGKGEEVEIRWAEA